MNRKQLDDDFALTFSEVLLHVASITRDCVRMAMELPYRPMGTDVSIWDDAGVDGNEPDSERPARDYVSADQAADILDATLMATTPTYIDVKLDRAGTSGERQAPEDVLLHDYFRHRVTSELGDMIQATSGEESSEAELAAYWTIRPDFSAVVDAIDGTILYRVLRTAFSVNVGLYERMFDEKHRLVATVCTSSTSETMIVDVDRRVTTMMTPGGYLTVPVFDPNAARVLPGTIAIVAGNGFDRDAHWPILDPRRSFALPPTSYGGVERLDPALQVYTAGGAPAMIGYPMSELAFALVSRPSKRFDVFPLVGALLAGGCRYYAFDHGWASIDQVLGWMEVDYLSSPVLAKGFPAGILVRDGIADDTVRLVISAGYEVMTNYRDAQTRGDRNTQEILRVMAETDPTTPEVP